MFRAIWLFPNKLFISSKSPHPDSTPLVQLRATFLNPLLPSKAAIAQPKPYLHNSFFLCCCVSPISIFLTIALCCPVPSKIHTKNQLFLVLMLGFFPPALELSPKEPNEQRESQFLLTFHPPREIRFPHHLHTHTHPPDSLSPRREANSENYMTAISSCLLLLHYNDDG